MHLKGRGNMVPTAEKWSGHPVSVCREVAENFRRLPHHGIGTAMPNAIDATVRCRARNLPGL